MRDLTRLLSPKSIAVFGGAWAENVIRQCRALGFEGEVWPVHPNRNEIGGVKCFPDIAALPSAPDAAFVGVNRHATLEVLLELKDVGCGGAISFASGFAETGDHDLQAAFLAAAGEMPVLGPNCYGMLNCLDGAMIWPDEQGCVPVETGVAILTQSSNIGMTLTMQRRGLPIAYLACLGNAAQVGLADLGLAMLSDPRVTALGIYMEGIGDAVAFARLVYEARKLGKRIIVLKAGHSSAGQAVAATHTASLAGNAVVSSAFFKQLGVGEVRSLPQLIEALKALHVAGPLSGESFVSVSCSGGEAGLVADTAEGMQLEFPPFADASAGKLSELLGPLVTISNPLDYHTFIWGDVERTTDVFCAAAANFDGALFVIDQPRPDRCDVSSFDPAFEAIIATQAATGTPVFAVSTLPETVDEALAGHLMERGVTPMLGVGDALAALEAVTVSPGVDDWMPHGPTVVGETTYLSEAEGKALLSEMGVSVPRGVCVSSIEAADTFDLQPPFAVKGLGFEHKSEFGAVRLNVFDLGAVNDMPPCKQYLIEEMVPDGVAELLVSVARDPIYGVALTVGFGGVEAELLADVATLVAPAKDQEIRAALKSLRLWPRLNGYRGKPIADADAVVDVVLRIQNAILSDASLVDIEINPLIVRQRGAVAVDALIRKEL